MLIIFNFQRRINSSDDKSNLPFLISPPMGKLFQSTGLGFGFQQPQNSWLQCSSQRSQFWMFIFIGAMFISKLVMVCCRKKRGLQKLPPFPDHFLSQSNYHHHHHYHLYHHEQHHCHKYHRSFPQLEPVTSEILVSREFFHFHFSLSISSHFNFTFIFKKSEGI